MKAWNRETSSRIFHDPNICRAQCQVMVAILRSDQTQLYHFLLRNIFEHVKCFVFIYNLYTTVFMASSLHVITDFKSIFSLKYPENSQYLTMVWIVRRWLMNTFMDGCLNISLKRVHDTACLLQWWQKQLTKAYTVSDCAYVELNMLIISLSLQVVSVGSGTHLWIFYSTPVKHKLFHKV